MWHNWLEFWPHLWVAFLSHQLWRYRILISKDVNSYHLQISQHDLSMYVDDNDLPNYLRKMSMDGTRGDHLAIITLAHALGRNIWIVSSSQGNGDHIVIESGNPRADPLLLGYISDNHYVSLEPDRQFISIQGEISWPFLGDTNLHLKLALNAQRKVLAGSFCPWHYEYYK